MPYTEAFITIKENTMRIQVDPQGNMLRRRFPYYYTKVNMVEVEAEMFVDQLKYESVETTRNGYAYFVFRSVTTNAAYYVMRSDFDKFMKQALQPDGTFIAVFGYRVSGRTQGIRVVGKVLLKLSAGV